MKTYVVVAAKPVRVRVGTQENSELKTFNKSEEFETAPVFAQDLVTAGYVKEKASKSSSSTKKTGESK